jgi:hypothetical protein
MKFEVTHPKIWNKLAEKNIPMKHKIQIYEKLGGAYRLGEDGGEQVFNKMTELLRNKLTEGDEKSPEETLDGLKNMAMGDLERIGDYAGMIAQRMGEGQELSSWMYSQITLAVDQLNSVHDAMDGKDGEKEQLKEASEVQLKDLQPTQQKQVMAFEKLIGGKVDSIFDGIHGFIVDIKVSGGHGNYRFEADDLKKLLSLKVRWIEADGDYISIAF